MFLKVSELAKKEAWAAADVALPQFDIAAVKAETKKAPTWVHFGAGNIFRAFPAAIQQTLLNTGIAKTGIVVAEGYDLEIIDSAFAPYENLTMLVTLKADGSIEKTIIGSIVEALKADRTSESDFARLETIFRNPSLKMVSFTITEKGYSLVSANGARLPDVEADFAAGPAAASSYIGKLAALCCARYEAGAFPLALVSMDNCSHNGTKLQSAVHAFAEAWKARGLVDTGFYDYLCSDRVSFPWSMIDKITPRPDNSVKEILQKIGFEDTEAVITAKSTYISPFVNAEETQYLIIEDNFPNGRPPLDQAGVIFTTREAVDKVEKMKVCTCLNPLHTALAVFGCLLGYTKISAEMQDKDLVSLVENIGYGEGLPVVVSQDILNPKEFIDTCLRLRFPNPFMPDTPQRIATDTSQKLPIRFGETIKAYAESPQREAASLRYIPLVLAGWCRYLMGIDDAGNTFALSPDPLAETLLPRIKALGLGMKNDTHAVLSPILSNADIFAVNLYDVGLGEKVEAFFDRLAAGVGAVRQTLRNI
jgi:fructuronate reductase